MIHALFHGYALCGFSQEVPGNWPEGHVWVAVGPGQELAVDPELRRNFCPRCLPLVCSSQVLTIHVLHHGEAICGFEREPGKWPEGHMGVEVSDWSANPNCKECLSVLNRTHKRKTVYDHLRDNADEGVEDPT